MPADDFFKCRRITRGDDLLDCVRQVERLVVDGKGVEQIKRRVTLAEQSPGGFVLLHDLQARIDDDDRRFARRCCSVGRWVVVLTHSRVSARRVCCRWATACSWFGGVRSEGVESPVSSSVRSVMQ